MPTAAPVSARRSARPKPLQDTRLCLVLGVCYLAADLILNKFALGDGWSIFWPLNGTTIALLIMQPRRRWVWILTGVALGTGIGECIDGNPIGFELLERSFSITEVLLAASLLPPFDNLEQWLRTPRLFERFAVALLMGPGISGVFIALLFRHIGRASFLGGLNAWAVSDVLGIAATMPLALALVSREFHDLFRRNALPRTLAILGTALAVIVLIFSVKQYPLLFLLYPALVLVDSQLGFAGTALAIFSAANISIYLTMHHHGPLAVWPANLFIPRAAALQIYLGFNLISVLPASVLFAERKWIERELRDALDRLSVLAMVDSLTGIANRRALDQRLAQEWSRAYRAGSALTLMIADLDMFKQFNDIYGHQAGDDCLRTVAHAFSAVAQRASDFVGRFGGEELVLLLPQMTAEQCYPFAERVRASIAALSIEHRGSPHGRVTVSIGCATLYPEREQTSKELLEQADRALYRAKQEGRNRVCFAAALQPDAAL